MAKKNDAELRGELPTPAGYLDDNRYITPGLKHDDRPHTRQLPTVKEMGELSNSEILKVLNHYGITEPYGILQSQAMEYVRRMMPLRSEADIQAAFNELINNERRQLLGVSRRVSQQWSTLDAIQGDINKELIWLAEDDEATCESCAPRSGDIDTFAGWKARGLPGSATCRGGNYCRCDLVVID